MWLPVNKTLALLSPQILTESLNCYYYLFLTFHVIQFYLHAKTFNEFVNKENECPFTKTLMTMK